MLRRCIEFLGVDYRQWRALTLTSLKLDLRTSSLGHTRTSKGDLPGSKSYWIFRLFIYAVMGAFVSPLIWVNKDVFFTGTIFFTYIMVMIAMLVLVDFAAVVISPDDFNILGFQPISSRTFFMARLANTLICTTAVALALGLVPVGSYFFTRGWNPWLGLAAIAATLLSSTTIVLTIVVLYAAILRVVHPNKLRRAFSYVQFLLSFLFYGGYMLLPRLFESKAIGTATLEKKPWVFLIPATWFASYLDLAVGKTGLVEAFPATATLVGLVFLMMYARGKLSLEYANRLSAAAARSEDKVKSANSAARPSRIFKSGERRAVLLLVRNQFKYDTKFRLAVLAILPITIFYLILGLRHGAPKDPFVESAQDFSNIWMLYLAVLLLPIMLKNSMVQSDAYRASWIYFAAPADKGRLILATKDFVFVYFVLPYLIFIGAILLYFFRNPWHVLLHLLLLALLSHLLLQFITFINPVLPFSRPVRKGERSSMIMLLFMIMPALGIGVIYLFTRWVYPNPMLHAAVLTVLLSLSLLLEKAVRARVKFCGHAFHFAG